MKTGTHAKEKLEAKNYAKIGGRLGKEREEQEQDNQEARKKMMRNRVGAEGGEWDRIGG